MQDRVIDLEIKLAFLENYSAQLDEVLQQALSRIERLEREVDELREARSAFSVRGDAESERPPHHDKL